MKVRDLVYELTKHDPDFEVMVGAESDDSPLHKILDLVLCAEPETSNKDCVAIIYNS